MCCRAVVRCLDASTIGRTRTERAFLKPEWNEAGRQWRERTTANWSAVQGRSLSASPHTYIGGGLSGRFPRCQGKPASQKRRIEGQSESAESNGQSSREVGLVTVVSPGCRDLGLCSPQTSIWPVGQQPPARRSSSLPRGLVGGFAALRTHLEAL